MPTSGCSGRGRPRLEDTDRRIVQATLELLREQGPAAVNVGEVAARSGVARTTVYRRYRDRDEVLAAALEGLTERSLPPPELPIAEKLRWVLERVSDMLEHGLGRGGTAAVLADSDPTFTTALRARMADRLASLSEMMAVDVEAGRLSPRADPDTVVGLLYGAYLSEVLRYGSPRRGWMDRTIDLLAAAVAAD